MPIEKNTPAVQPEKPLTVFQRLTATPTAIINNTRPRPLVLGAAILAPGLNVVECKKLHLAEPGFNRLHNSGAITVDTSLTAAPQDKTDAAKIWEIQNTFDIKPLKDMLSGATGDIRKAIQAQIKVLEEAVKAAKGKDE